MLSLPSKPWKKVRIEAIEGQEYRITFLTQLGDETQFLEAVDDIAASLGAQDRLGQCDWPSRSVLVTTADLSTLKRNLVFASIMIEVE